MHCKYFLQITLLLAIDICHKIAWWTVSEHSGLSKIKFNQMERFCSNLLTNGFCFLAVQETVVSEEIMHNLDTCEVTVVGDELNGDHESLEVDLAQIQQRTLEMSSSNVGMVITGTHPSTSKNYCYIFAHICWIIFVWFVNGSLYPASWWMADLMVLKASVL